MLGRNIPIYFDNMDTTPEIEEEGAMVTSSDPSCS